MSLPSSLTTMAVVHFLASLSSHLAHRISPLRVTSFFSSARSAPAKTRATARASETDRSFLITEPPLWIKAQLPGGRHDPAHFYFMDLLGLAEGLFIVRRPAYKEASSAFTFSSIKSRT